MWNYIFCEDKNKVESAFYCGDAAGRNFDFSDSDLKFSQNISIQFFYPEQLFPIYIPDFSTYKIIVLFGNPTTDDLRYEYYNKYLSEKTNIIYDGSSPTNIITEKIINNNSKLSEFYVLSNNYPSDHSRKQLTDLENIGIIIEYIYFSAIDNRFSKDISIKQYFNILTFPKIYNEICNTHLLQ